MAVKAVLSDGREVVLSPQYGESIDDLAAGLGLDLALVGSGAPSLLELDTADGGVIAYADVNRFVAHADLLPPEGGQ